MQFRRPGKPNVAINIAPLVDVVFLLVIFFAVSTTFLESAGLKLELPTSSGTVAKEPRELTVLMAADGNLSFDGVLVDEDQLGRQLRDALSDAEKKVVTLRADTEAEHGDVVRIMDIIREAGAESLNVAARSAS